MNIYKFQCPSNNETKYVQDIVCKVHRNSAGSLLLTAHASLMIPADYIQIHVIFAYTNTNKTLVDLSFEYCSSFKKLPLFMSLALEVMKGFSNDLIKSCPYEPKKHIGVENLPIDNFGIMLPVFNFQLGNYKVFVEFKDRKNQTMFYCTVLATLARRRKKV